MRKLNLVHETRLAQPGMDMLNINDIHEWLSYYTYV
jgi:hypothetical protein